MSRFFTLSPRPGVETFNLSVRLDKVMAVFTTVHRSYDKVTKNVERKRWFLRRWLLDWNTPINATETVEVTEEIWYKYYKICASDRMTEQDGRYLVLAKTRDGKLADEAMKELCAALEAS